MGPAEWRLAAFAMTLLALAFTGTQLVRSIWRGRPVCVARYRSILVVLLAAGVLLSLSGDHADETVVVAGTVETAPCLGTTGVRAFQPHGERVAISGVGRTGPDCGIWATIEDVGSGVIWLQGPAILGDEGWNLDLVMGTGDALADPLRYDVSLVAADAAIHDGWQAAARAGQPVRLPFRPTAVSQITQRRFELRRAGDVASLIELPPAR